MSRHIEILQRCSAWLTNVPRLQAMNMLVGSTSLLCPRPHDADGLLHF
jgi:hypothetical protein